MKDEKENRGITGKQFAEKEKSAKLLNSKSGGGIIDIKIDKITPCLEEVKTGKIVDTQYNVIEVSKAFAKQLKTEKWKFDWYKTKGEVYQLTLERDRLIQGLISLEDRNDHIYVELVESAPKNIGKNKIYSGVGAHLFAIAAEKSFDAGYEGYVVLKPKTALTEHYKNKLGAIMMPNGNMNLSATVSIALIEKYIKKE